MCIRDRPSRKRKREENGEGDMKNAHAPQRATLHERGDREVKVEEMEESQEGDSEDLNFLDYLIENFDSFH